MAVSTLSYPLPRGTSKICMKSTSSKPRESGSTLQLPFLTMHGVLIETLTHFFRGLVELSRFEDMHSTVTTLGRSILYVNSKLKSRTDR